MYKRRMIWVLPALVVAPLVIVGPFLQAFVFTSAAAPYTDLAIAHYPNLLFLFRSFVQEHAIPLWSPSILSGFPFTANPLSGLWYPPGWLAMLFPVPFGFNLIVILHMMWGGAGMYLLLREEKIGPWAALLGGLAFELMPKGFAHLAAGHVSLLYAVFWTPWLLLAHQKRHGWLQPGIILGVIALADMRWGFYAGLLWFGWSFAHRHVRGGRRSETIFFIKHGLLALGLSAPLTVPLFEFVNLSTRSSLSSHERLVFSLPPARLLGLVFPDFGGMQEWVLYPGGAILVLCLAGILLPRVRKKGGFWIWVGLLSLLFSLGEQLPFSAFLVQLPGANWLRVPSRSLFLTGMSLVALASISLDSLQVQLLPGLKKRVNLGLAGMAGFGLTFVAVVWVLTGSVSLSSIWGGAAVSTGALAVAFLGVQKIPRKWRSAMVTGIMMIDLLGVNFQLLHPRSATAVLSEGQEVARFLSGKEGIFRVYSPSYSIPQQTSVRFGLEMASGVDPLQLADYADFMALATGVPRNGYSVTLPPLGGKPAQANAEASLSPALLGKLNVRYVVSEFDLENEALILERQFGESRVYRNLLVRPRAWIQSSGDSTEVIDRQVEILSKTSNRIVVSADGPGLLVLSELIYPGWSVKVDGKRAQIQRVDKILRGVTLAGGYHQVVFEFLPVSVYVGLAIFMATVLIGLGWTLILKREEGSR